MWCILLQQHEDSSIFSVGYFPYTLTERNAKMQKCLEDERTIDVLYLYVEGTRFVVRTDYEVPR